jgi:hypothetical protein
MGAPSQHTALTEDDRRALSTGLVALSAKHVVQEYPTLLPQLAGLEPPSMPNQS